MKVAVSYVLKNYKAIWALTAWTNPTSRLPPPQWGGGNTILSPPPLSQRKKIKRWVFFVDIFLEENYDFNVFECNIFYIYIY